MKHFYLVMFLFVCTLGFSQESAKSSMDIDGFKLYPNPVTQGKVFIETTHNSPKKSLFLMFWEQKCSRLPFWEKNSTFPNWTKGSTFLGYLSKTKWPLESLLWSSSPLPSTFSRFQTTAINALQPILVFSQHKMVKTALFTYFYIAHRPQISIHEENLLCFTYGFTSIFFRSRPGYS